MRGLAGRCQPASRAISITVNIVTVVATLLFKKSRAPTVHRLDIPTSADADAIRPLAAEARARGPGRRDRRLARPDPAQAVWFRLRLRLAPIRLTGHRRRTAPRTWGRTGAPR